MNKRGGSNKACSWEIFLKKNKKNFMLIREFRVCVQNSERPTGTDRLRIVFDNEKKYHSYILF